MDERTGDLSRAAKRGPASETAPGQRPDPAPDTVAAFSAFYRGHVTRLVGFLVWQGASVTDAADVAQETMRRALEHWATIRAPWPWACRVASREYARRAGGLVEEPVDDPAARNPLLRAAPSEITAWEESQEVLRLLDQLPARQRQVMAWTLEGWRPAEIAEQLRMTPAAVRANLGKARRRLAGLLAGAADPR